MNKSIRRRKDIDEREGKKPPSLRLSPRNCLGIWSKLISLAEAKQRDLLVRLGTVEQGMFEEKSLDPDMNGDLGSTNLEHTASWLSCEVRGETTEVAISDSATDEEEEEEED